MSIQSAITLLLRHSQGEKLVKEDRDTMLIALHEFWRRDRMARKWANVREGTDVLHYRVHRALGTTIGDIVQDLVLDVLTRKWPPQDDLEKISTGYLAETLQARLRHAYTRGERFAKRHRALPEDDDSPAIELGQFDLRGTADWADEAGGASTSAGEQEIAIEVAPTPQQGDGLAFATRCYHASQRFMKVHADDLLLLSIIDAYLAPFHLDEVKVTGKQVAEKFNFTAVRMTRVLQKYGIRLPRTKKADAQGLESLKQVWTGKPLGIYLFKDCGVTSTEQMVVALKSLCACNREHLEALIEKNPNTGAQA